MQEEIFKFFNNLVWGYLKTTVKFANKCHDEVTVVGMNYWLL